MTYGPNTYNAEVVTLGRGVLRAEVNQRHFSDMSVRANPLHNVAKLDIIPINVPTVFVQNWKEFLQDSGGYNPRNPSQGRYYPRTKGKDEKRIEIGRLEHELGVSLPEAIVLPTQSRWDVFRHEALHAVFAHLSGETVRGIVESSPLHAIHLATVPNDNPMQPKDYVQLSTEEQIGMIDEEVARIFQIKGTTAYDKLIPELPKSFIGALKEAGYLI